jgi:prepilin-type N-terminal cleavage/methylation domain-containing protein
MSRKAFTLVELLVVVVILLTLAGLLIPAAIYSTKEKSPPNPFMTLPSPPSLKGGEAIPITIHGLKYTIIYRGPDDVEIYRQKECEDASISSENRKSFSH